MGFLQDLVNGLKKSPPPQQQSAVGNTASPNIHPNFLFKPTGQPVPVNNVGGGRAENWQTVGGRQPIQTPQIVTHLQQLPDFTTSSTANSTPNRAGVYQGPAYFNSGARLTPRIKA